MKCIGCGAHIKRNSSYCSTCGNPVENISVVNNTVVATHNKAPIFFFILICVLAISVLIFVSTVDPADLLPKEKTSPERAAEICVEHALQGRVRAFYSWTAFDMNAMMRDYIQELSEQNGCSISEIYQKLGNDIYTLEDLYDTMGTTIDEQLDKEYGKWRTISVTAIHTQNINKSAFIDHISKYSSLWEAGDFRDYMDIHKIKNGCIVTVNYKISNYKMNSDDETELTTLVDKQIDVILCELKSGWRLVGMQT